MKYLLMINVPSAEPYQLNSWPERELEAHLRHLKLLNRDLMVSGELVTGEVLASPDQAKLVRAGKSGEPVTDGVFAEAKEFLAGYWLVDVETPERAYEIAARASSAPGPGGLPLNNPIEVRRVMSALPQLEDEA